MSNLEHYFENLLFDGKDCRGDVNKNALTKEEQEAVEICAQYVIWSIFDGRDEFKNFIRQEFEPVKHGRWIERESGIEDKEAGFETVIVCSRCDFPAVTFYSEDCESRTQIRTVYCPNCGAKMDGGENGQCIERN